MGYLKECRSLFLFNKLYKWWEFSRVNTVNIIKFGRSTFFDDEQKKRENLVQLPVAE